MKGSTKYIALALLGLFFSWKQLYFGALNDLGIYDSADWWDENSPYSILKLMNEARVPFFISRFPPVKTNPMVLDVGCGGGLVSEAVARAGYSVAGIDISVKSIAVASAHASLSSDRLPVTYLVGSVYAIPFENASVDAVIISDVLEHLNDVPAALLEIKRVLKPKGVLVFDTIARTWWSWLSTFYVAQQLFGIVASGAHDWSMFINPEELERMLIENGFETKREEWEGIVPELSMLDAIEKQSLVRVIRRFSVDKSDFSASYMGFAYNSN